MTTFSLVTLVHGTPALLGELTVRPIAVIFWSYFLSRYLFSLVIVLKCNVNQT